MEITAAGIDDANVNPTFNPRYTFAAVKMSVIAPPKSKPRRLSSLRCEACTKRLISAAARVSWDVKFL
jgi:hypothetical protein